MPITSPMNRAPRVDARAHTQAAVSHHHCVRVLCIESVFSYAVGAAGDAPVRMWGAVGASDYAAACVRRAFRTCGGRRRSGRETPLGAFGLARRGRSRNGLRRGDEHMPRMAGRPGAGFQQGRAQGDLAETAVGVEPGVITSSAAVELAVMRMVTEMARRSAGRLLAMRFRAGPGELERQEEQ